MRIAIAVPLLLLAACNVSKDGNGTTVTLDQGKAENTLDTVGDEVKNAGGAIVADVKQTGSEVSNKVGDVDVKIDTDKDHDGNSADNNDGNKAN